MRRPYVLFPTGVYLWQSPKVGNLGTFVASKDAHAGVIPNSPKTMPTPKRPMVSQYPMAVAVLILVKAIQPVTETHQCP